MSSRNAGRQTKAVGEFGRLFIVQPFHSHQLWSDVAFLNDTAAASLAKVSN